MSTINAITEHLFGVSLPDQTCRRGLNIDFDRCPMDTLAANHFNGLLKIMSSPDNVVKDLGFLHAVITVGLKLSNARLIGHRFWSALMDINYLPKAKVEDDSELLNLLLSQGLALHERDSWNNLALLLDICYEVPRAKQVAVKLISSKYATKIGILLDNSKDFQQANFVIELLANCFPRKSVQEPGVVHQPELWEEDSARNDRIFKNPLYPFRGKHGDSQVIGFIWNMLKIEGLVRVDNINYGTSNNGHGIKRLKLKKGSKSSSHCYLQVIYNSIFIWDGEGMFLEIDRRYVDILKTLKGAIKISVIEKSNRCFNSINKLWLDNFTNVKWIQIEINDRSVSDKFFENVISIRKVSEVQTFLALDHTDEEISERTEDIPVKAGEFVAPNFAKDSFKPDVFNVDLTDQSITKNQLATPEKSDVKICSDEWDFNPSSEQHGTAISEEQAVNQVTPQQSMEPHRPEPYHDEESPLVLAQKRKMIRETTRTLEVLKKDFSLKVNISPRNEKTNGADRSPSIMITKFEKKTKTGNEGSAKLTETFTKRPPDLKIKTPKIKAVKSIAARDIDVLDTIFGKRETLSTRKRQKRQQRLGNYKPVIEVASQDVPKVPANKARKKEPMVARKEAITKVSYKNDIATIPDAEANLKIEPQKHVLEEDVDQKFTPKIQKTSPKVSMKKSNVKLAAEVKPLDEDTAKKSDNGKRPTSQKQNSSSFLESTTIVGNTSYPAPAPLQSSNVLTDKLQEQIFNSITHFSNEMIRKMTIINKELNNKIVKELSEKYQRIFQELQISFQNDTEEMLGFMGEIKDMMNLPEDQLIQVIRDREFGRGSPH